MSLPRFSCSAISHGWLSLQLSSKMALAAPGVTISSVLCWEEMKDFHILCHFLKSKERGLESPYRGILLYTGHWPKAMIYWFWTSYLKRMGLPWQIILIGSTLPQSYYWKMWIPEYENSLKNEEKDGCWRGNWVSASVLNQWLLTKKTLNVNDLWASLIGKRNKNARCAIIF